VVRRIELSSPLPVDADRVWAAVQQSETFRYVTRGVLGFPALSGRTATIREGESVTGWLLLFHLLPLHRHTIRVVRVDHGARTLETEEGGGVLRRWNHRLSVVPLPGGTSRYSDVVDIDAGALTGVVAATSTALYRYRQRRWRRLARRL
jgi:hypothetical protein